MSKVFSTLDIYLASFLSLHNLEPILEDRNGKIIFIFIASDDLYQLINQFNSNEFVPVNDFITRVKTLRGKMLTAREAIEGNGKGARYGKANQ